MASIMQLGLGLGLAGAAGIRAYFPLIVMGLLTRYSETLTYRAPFKILGSIPVMLLVVVLTIFELLREQLSEDKGNQSLIVVGYRILAGAILFAGVFNGFGVFLGLIFGGAISLLSHLILLRLKSGNERYPIFRNYSAGVENTLTIIITLLAVLFPWSTYLFWGVIVVILFRKVRTNSRYKSDSRVKTWR